MKTSCIYSLTMIFIMAGFSTGELPLHRKPVALELSGQCGGRLDGTAWSSSEISGKVFSVYYIDPDEADLNEPLFTALKAENFPADKVQSVAIINMKATWMPGGILSMLLKRKQKKYQTTIYIKDNCKKVLQTWTLADHSSDILLFNQRGEVIFSKDGRFSDAQIREMVALIWQTISGKPADASQK
jgi:predicted transcriptional regulator